MRIDLVLKYLCLLKSRSQAKTLADKHLIAINGEPVRASQTVHAGDRISLTIRRETHSIEVVSVPEKQLSKSDAPSYYKMVETEPGDGH